jgi:hypothetical protein
MDHPALPRITSGLAGTRAALLAGDYEAMHTQLVLTLDALAEVTRQGLVPEQERAAVRWDEAQATGLVWQLLARFRAERVHVFPYAGTLLGLERDGRLLPNDKDSDFAVWLEDYALAGRLLQQWGLQRAADVPPFDNVSTWVEPGSGLSLDLFGLRRNPVRACTEGGAWLYGRPASHQRLVLLPWLELGTRAGPAGEVWWPERPQHLLQAMYGDWRIRQPDWDTQVSNLALVDLNLSWRCWALRSLCERWLTGDLARTRALLAQIAARGGDDAQLQSWREALS